MAGAALLATVIAVVALAGGAAGAPDDDLAPLVPSTALVYAHASTAPGREADARLARTLEKLPGARELRAAALRQVGGRSRGFSFARDIRPWLGDEAAFALLPSPNGGAAESLVLAAVRDRDLARVFVARAGARGVRRYRGVDVLELGEVSAAVSGEVLLLGQAAGVRTAIDLQQGRGRGLAGEPAYRRAAVPGAEDRVLELYATPEGARGVLAPRAGPLAGLLRTPGLQGARAAVAPARQAGVRVRLRATRGPAAPRTGGFSPRLARAAPRGAAGVIALGSADPLARRLLEAVPGLGEAARAAGVDLERDLLAPLRGGEVALWATPGDPVPGVALAARTRDPGRTREALGRLQAPLAQVLGPGVSEAGQVPLFEQREVAGVPAFVLPLALGTELAYAVTGDRLVLSTGTDAIGRIRRPGPGLLAAAQDGGRIELPSEQAEAIVFTRPEQLLALGDLLGLTADPAVQAVRDDLDRVRSLSVVARREKTDTTAELLFQIP